MSSKEYPRFNIGPSPESSGGHKSRSGGREASNSADIFKFSLVVEHVLIMGSRSGGIHAIGFDDQVNMLKIVYNDFHAMCGWSN